MFTQPVDATLFDQDLVGGVDTLDRTNSYDGSSWSTELRLDYSGDSVDWTIGAMYSSDDQNQNNLVAISTSPTHSINGVGWLPPFPEDLGLAFNNKTFDTVEQALFADITLHVTDTMDLIAGGRFTNSQVDKAVQSAGLQSNGGPPPGFTNEFRPLSAAESDFRDFAPRFGARFQVTDEINIYAMVSKGYKPGGNSVGNNTNVGSRPSENVAFNTKYDKETLWNYEMGFKSELFDNRLRLNVSIFHMKWNNLQFESFFFLTPGNLSTNFEQFINIEDAEADGLEAEFIALVTDNLTISGGFGWLHTEITSPTTVELSGGWRPDLNGHKLPKSPDITGNIVGEYRCNKVSWVMCL